MQADWSNGFKHLWFEQKSYLGARVVFHNGEGTGHWTGKVQGLKEIIQNTDNWAGWSIWQGFAEDIVEFFDSSITFSVDPTKGELSADLLGVNSDSFNKVKGLYINIDAFVHEFSSYMTYLLIT